MMNVFDSKFNEYTERYLFTLRARYGCLLKDFRRWPCFLLRATKESLDSHLEAYLKVMRDDRIVYVSSYPEMLIKMILDISGGRQVMLVASIALRRT